jgi:hypothetical protein
MDSIPSLKGNFGPMHEAIQRNGISDLINTKPHHRRPTPLWKKKETPRPIPVKLPYLEPGLNPLLSHSLTPIALHESFH